MGEGVRSRARGAPRGVRVALEALPPPRRPQRRRSGAAGRREARAAGGSGGRGRAPSRGSAFRMKSGLNAAGFAGAVRIRDVSRAKYRREALVAQCEPLLRGPSSSAVLPLLCAEPGVRAGAQPSSPSCPAGQAETWKEIK